jgi:hypothetical protein
MNPSRLAPSLAFAALAATSLVSHAQAGNWRNVTAGGPLRPGIYGRIEVRGAVPPPVIYHRPVMASHLLLPPDAKPVYLYVPPGQVRKWKRNCARWKACDEAVLFVRVDHSPSRWGRWRQWREDLALHGAAAR